MEIVIAVLINLGILFGGDGVDNANLSKIEKGNQTSIILEDMDDI